MPLRVEGPIFQFQFDLPPDNKGKEKFINFYPTNSLSSSYFPSLYILHFSAFRNSSLFLIFLFIYLFGSNTLRIRIFLASNDLVHHMKLPTYYKLKKYDENQKIQIESEKNCGNLKIQNRSIH